MQFLSFTLLHSTLPSARSFFFLLGKKIVSLQYLSVSGAVRTALLYRFIKLVDFVKSFHSLQLAPKNEQPKNTKSFLHVSASVLSWAAVHFYNLFKMTMNKSWEACDITFSRFKPTTAEPHRS